MRWRLTKLGWGLVGTVVLTTILLVTLLLPGTAPWTKTGTLLVAVHAVPTTNATTSQFGIGFDDVTLQTEDGQTIPTHLLSKRALLTLDRADLVQVLRVPVPVGTYSGISFQLKSPELRNDWQGDLPPLTITLLHSLVTLPISLTIEEDRETAVILGLETLQAIRTIDGRQIYAPAMQIEIRKDGIATQSNGAPLHVEGGTIVSSTMYGMDWNGVMRQNYRAEAAPQNETLPPTNEYASRHSAVQDSNEVPEINQHSSSTEATTTASSTLRLDANETTPDTL